MFLTLLLSGCGDVGLDDNEMGEARVEVEPPGRLDLGTVSPAGHSAEGALVVTSVGTERATIEEVWIEGEGFTLAETRLPRELDPGESLSFAVRFRPTTQDVYTGTVGVVTESENTIQRAVVGRGCRDDDLDGLCD